MEAIQSLKMLGTTLPYNASHPRRPESLGTFNIYVYLFVGMSQIITGKISNMGIEALLTVVPLTF
jgi:hypothetical protein